MPDYSFFVYAPDVLVYDPNTNEFNFAAGYDWQTDRNRVDYSDDDTVFDGDGNDDGLGDDLNQTGAAYDDTGALLEAGSVYVQHYAEILSPTGDTIYLDRIEIDGVHVGYVPSSPLTPGTSYSVVNSYNVGRAVDDGSGGTTDNTMFHSYYQSNSVPCFDAATLIATPQGDVPVGRITVGTMVCTLDHGPQPVRWRSTRRVKLSPDRPDDWPVLIPAGGFGKACPASDLIVSAQHRVLMGHAQQGADALARETLVPAKALIGAVPGVRWMRGRTQANWVHLALPRHAILVSNGAYLESLLLGAVALDGLAPFARLHLRHLARLGLIASSLKPARTCLGASAARAAIASNGARAQNLGERS